MYDFDQVVLLQDYYHDLSTALLPGYLTSGNENAEPLPDNGLIQGTNLYVTRPYICSELTSKASIARRMILTVATLATRIPQEQ